MRGAATADRTPKARRSASAGLRARLHDRDFVVLALLLTALSVSWYYSWFLDGSHPLGGMGWADQSSYTHAALRLAHGHLPTRNQMHFSPTYPLLGAIGSIFSRNDPFWIVSFSLLIGSAIFIYRAARTMLGLWFTVLFMILLFVWDGYARTLNFVSEVFAVPWNNQVLFFAFAYFFWIYTTKASGPLSSRIVVSTGVIVGLLATTREESVLFCVPLAAFYLWYRRATLRNWITCGVAVFLTALPGVTIKWIVLGSIFATGRARDYGNSSELYFSGSNLWHHFLETIVNSDFAPRDYNRISLFEAQPWLWLAPIGLVILLVSKRFGPLIKFYVAMSIALIMFYLSGVNVAGARLRYHCLRYMSPGYIALTLASVVTLQQLWLVFVNWRGRAEHSQDLSDDLSSSGESESALDEPAMSSAPSITKEHSPLRR